MTEAVAMSASSIAASVSGICFIFAFVMQMSQNKEAKRLHEEIEAFFTRAKDVVFLSDIDVLYHEMSEFAVNHDLRKSHRQHLTRVMLYLRGRKEGHQL